MAQGLLLSVRVPEGAPESWPWGPRPQPHSIQTQLLVESQPLGRKDIDLKGSERGIRRHTLQRLEL